MKKVILTLAAAALSAGLAFAQDIATATQTYNNGAEALASGNKAEALSTFKKALELGQACGAEGEELVANCKKAIPGVLVSMGKESFNGKDFAAASEKFAEAEKLAKEYGDEELATEAGTLVKQAGAAKYLNEANTAFANKDYEAAAAGYKEALAVDPTNKAAALRSVQALANSGKLAEAKEAYKLAEELGQGENAGKVLGGAYLKSAVAALKGGQYAQAIQMVDEADNYTQNAQAYQIAGQAAQKLGQDAKAISYFEKYLTASPNAKNAGQIALTIGALYQKAQNKAKALEFYQKAQAHGVDAQQYINAVSK